MKKTQLLTEFVRVATSGRTADGRTIEAEDLKAMAKNYNPELYTAQIWLEHERYFPPLGQVVSLQAVENGDKTELFAQLAPSYEMIAMNKRGQGLFTSIEITPDFAETGEAYLTGLAVTDSPASTGTTQLAFNSQKHPVIVSDNLRLNFNLSNGQKTMGKDKENAKWSFFSWLFSKDEPEEPEVPANPTVPEEPADKGETHFNENEEMNQKQILAMATAIAAAFSAQQGKGLNFSEEEKEEEKVTIPKAEYDALKEAADKAAEAEKKAEEAEAELTDLEERVANLEDQFSVVRKKAVNSVPQGAENKYAVKTAI